MPEPTILMRGRTLVAVTDVSNTDYTTDAQFYAYMQLRIHTPAKVVLFDTRHELEQTMRKKGVMV